MLVLRRRVNEALLIGNDIRVTVFQITGEKVVLGIDAPRDVAIDRLEVRESKEAAIRKAEGRD